MHHDHDHCGHHGHCHNHDHAHCACGGHCHQEQSALEEITALMKYMVSHNASHARELADLASQLQKAGQPEAYEQVLKAVSDFEKGNLRLSAVLAGLHTEG